LTDSILPVAEILGLMGPNRASVCGATWPIVWAIGDPTIFMFAVQLAVMVGLSAAYVSSASLR